jgi:dihydroorotase
MGVILRGGRVLVPARAEPAPLDVAVQDGLIQAIGADLKADDGDRVIDCSGLVVAPALVDLYTRVGEPGFEFREDLATLSAAAAAGGFVAVCSAPDSKPINDTKAVTELILSRAREVGGVEVWPLAALTEQLGDDNLSELGELAEAGAVAASTGRRWLAGGGIARRGFEYARTFDLPVMVTPYDRSVAGNGVVHESALATRLGLRGVPVAAESAALARDLELAELTGARLIATHLSSARAVGLIREAKARGVGVVGATTVHQLVLDESAVAGYDPVAKLWPPLRSGADRDALVAAVADGTIDCVFAGHDPQAVVDKDHEFDDAAPGASSIELALAVLLDLVAAGKLTLDRAIDAASGAPRRALARSQALEAGARADLCVFDPEREWTVEPARMHSRSKSTPLAGRRLRGQVRWTVAAGEVIYEAKHD